MKKAPLISIITPTLNAGSSIESLIVNVASQTYENTEFIVVDGLSADDTPKIIKKYQRRFNNIKFIHEKDFGVYDAMNKGVRISTGDYLYFLGSDDEFTDNHVLMDIFKQGLFKRNEIIYGNVKVIGDTGWAKDGDCYDGKFDLRKILFKNICHQAIFYPRYIFTKVGYYNINYKINADWDFNLRCWSQHEFVYYDRIIANFKAGGTSTNGLDLLFKEEFRSNISEYFKFDERSLNSILSKSAWGDISNQNKYLNLIKQRIFIKLSDLYSNLKNFK